MIPTSIETFWKESGARPEYIEVVRRALRHYLQSVSGRGTGRSLLARLPELCCGASGGDPAWGAHLSSAWTLFHLAAHLMDSVQDGDTPESWWAELGPGAALNVASGLFFTAERELHRLSQSEATRVAAAEIIADFHGSLLALSGGQHRDLTTPQPTLEQCLEIASAKSGTFFALACRAGARLATESSSRLDGYSRFGQALGLLIQVRDDLEDLLPSRRLDVQAADLRRSLPVAYALEVLPLQGRERLDACLSNLPRAWDMLLGIIEESGAALYLTLEMGRQWSQAQEALQAAAPQSPQREQLLELLQGVSRYEQAAKLLS